MTTAPSAWAEPAAAACVDDRRGRITNAPPEPSSLADVSVAVVVAGAGADVGCAGGAVVAGVTGAGAGVGDATTTP
jgi:anti-sigma factor RsiW